MRAQEDVEFAIKALRLALDKQHELDLKLIEIKQLNAAITALEWVNETSQNNSFESNVVSLIHRLKQADP